MKKLITYNLKNKTTQYNSYYQDRIIYKRKMIQSGRRYYLLLGKTGTNRWNSEQENMEFKRLNMLCIIKASPCRLLSKRTVKATADVAAAVGCTRLGYILLRRLKHSPKAKWEHQATRYHRQTATDRLPIWNSVLSEEGKNKSLLRHVTHVTSWQCSPQRKLKNPKAHL